MSAVSIGELLKGYVLADVTVAGLAGTRMYPLRLPEKATLPALVYQRISGERMNVLHGQASAAEPRYQIDAWAANQKDAVTLGAAVRQRIEAFTGTWTDGTISAFVQVRFVTERDFFEEDILGGACRHSADYFVFHSTNGGSL